MEEAGWLISTSIFLLIFLLLLSKLTQSKHRSNLPPGPPALPFIGHLHLAREPLHRSLHNLTENYGHIFHLRLGTRNAVVVSSPSSIEECFTKNDIAFANRPQLLAGKHLNYNYKAVGFAPYGDHWRNLRRLMTLELLSTNKINMFAGIREEEVKLLVKQVFKECNKGQELSSKVVELRPRLVELSFNIIMRMMCGKRYYGDEVAEEGKVFQGLMREVMEIEGNGNLNDFLPILRWVDFQGLEKRMKKLMENMDGFLQNVVDEQRRHRSKGNNYHDMTMIDALLDLQEREKELEFYTDENIKGVILVMLLAGSETTATTIEWALSLLLNHPEAMTKTRVEIDAYVGQDKIVNEMDTTKLNYLQNVITETLRLYPPAPLMLPHESSQDCNVCGFDIPRGTMLLVNVWTLHRDANLWVDPSRFMPERFEGGKGGGEVPPYNMVPFGIGRRACAGTALAKRVMGHALGALVQSFEWDRIGDEEIEMTEGTGITVSKLEPLVALCKPRQGMIKALSNL